MSARPVHPLSAVAEVGRKAVEAAAASLAYWRQPASPPRGPVPDLTPLQQMYAYFD